MIALVNGADGTALAVGCMITAVLLLAIGVVILWCRVALDAIASDDDLD